MKRRKLFEISYVLNCFLYLSLLCFQILENIIYNYGPDILTILASLIILFVLVVAPFDWACHKLNKAYKNSLQLSKAVGRAVIIIGILFNILTVLSISGSMIYIRDYYTDQLNTGLSSIFYYFLYGCFMITSIYLSIAYWIIRRQVKLQETSIVSNLGSENKN
jgi:hypothetical protein